MSTLKPVAYSYVRSAAGRPREVQEGVTRAYYRDVLATPGVLWGGVFVDGGEAADLLDRPAGSALLSRLRPGDHVIAEDLSRLFTRQADGATTLESWADRGIYLHTVREGLDTSTEGGQGVAYLLWVFVEWGRELLAERFRGIHQRRRAKGIPFYGLPPLGQKFVGRAGERRLVPDPKELAQIQEIVRLHDEEGYTLQQIHLMFLRDGVRRSRGKPWGRIHLGRAYALGKGGQGPGRGRKPEVKG
jgi:DNA invertase Pin-like site-specific DNA recombinase